MKRILFLLMALALVALPTSVFAAHAYFHDEGQAQVDGAGQFHVLPGTQFQANVMAQQQDNGSATGAAILGGSFVSASAGVGVTAIGPGPSLVTTSSAVATGATSGLAWAEAARNSGAQAQGYVNIQTQSTPGFQAQTSSQSQGQRSVIRHVGIIP